MDELILVGNRKRGVLYPIAEFPNVVVPDSNRKGVRVLSTIDGILAWEATDTNGEQNPATLEHFTQEDDNEKVPKGQYIRLDVKGKPEAHVIRVVPDNFREPVLTGRVVTYK